MREAQACGIFTAGQVRQLYRRGERANWSILANEPPFDGGWEHWKPDPAWRVPLELPPGWNIV